MVIQSINTISPVLSNIRESLVSDALKEYGIRWKCAEREKKVEDIAKELGELEKIENDEEFIKLEERLRKICVSILEAYHGDTKSIAWINSLDQIRTTHEINEMLQKIVEHIDQMFIEAHNFVTPEELAKKYSGYKVFINRGRFQTEIYLGTKQEPSYLRTVAKIRAIKNFMDERLGVSWVQKVTGLNFFCKQIKYLPFMQSTIWKSFHDDARELRADKGGFDRYLGWLITRLNTHFRERKFLTFDEAFSSGKLSCYTICVAVQEALGNGWEIYHAIKEKKQNPPTIEIETHTFLFRKAGPFLCFLDPLLPTNTKVERDDRWGSKFKKFQKQYITHNYSLQPNKWYKEVMGVDVKINALPEIRFLGPDEDCTISTPAELFEALAQKKT